MNKMNKINVIYNDDSTKYEKLKKLYSTGIYLQKFMPYFFTRYVTNQCALKFWNNCTYSDRSNVCWFYNNEK